MSELNKNLVIQKSESWKMFDEISPRYDLLNHLLSFGLHIIWRKRLLQFIPEKSHLRLLDLATGTGDVLISLAKGLGTKLSYGLGLDLADKMLSIAQEKINRTALKNIEVSHGDAMNIPLTDNSFDVVTISFGIRNTENPTKVLSEMYHVLNYSGRAIILEFSLPKNGFVRALHLFYLRTLVPAIGWIFSGHYKAYKYLNQTIETFPYGESFCKLMKDAGFKNVCVHELLFGVATIYVGDKKPS